MFEDPRVFAAFGTAAIGLFAGAVGSIPTIRRAAAGSHRRRVAGWSAVFTFSIVAFCFAVCLLPSSLLWLAILPMCGIVVGVNRANRELVARTTFAVKR